MKKILLLTTLVIVAACSSTDATTKIELTGTAAEISEVVCDSTPTTNVTKSTQSTTNALTKVSWQCKRDGKTVKFDIYPSASAKDTASADALSLFGNVGGTQSWEMEPILCGATWTMSVVNVETRDLVIAEFNAKGITAATC